MQASIMAFDLLLSDQATPWERFVLRLMCLVAGMPFANFVTKTGYKKILTEAGYESTLIEMRDISEQVFPGIAKFLRKQDAELSKYGMTIGRYKGAANAFDWWGQTGVVRGVIVVVRRSENLGAEYDMTCKSAALYTTSGYADYTTLDAAGHACGKQSSSLKRVS
jgi:hypothetical protein